MTIKINDNGTDRNMTADEEATYLAWAVIEQAEAKAIKDAQTARDAQRQILLDRLGITADEAKLLLG